MYSLQYIATRHGMCVVYNVVYVMSTVNKSSKTWACVDMSSTTTINMFLAPEGLTWSALPQLNYYTLKSKNNNKNEAGRKMLFKNNYNTILNYCNTILNYCNTILNYCNYIELLQPYEFTCYESCTHIEHNQLMILYHLTMNNNIVPLLKYS